jgi:hypothetical protein
MRRRPPVTVHALRMVADFGGLSCERLSDHGTSPGFGDALVSNTRLTSTSRLDQIIGCILFFFVRLSCATCASLWRAGIRILQSGTSWLYEPQNICVKRRCIE